MSTDYVVSAGTLFIIFVLNKCRLLYLQLTVTFNTGTGNSKGYHRRVSLTRHALYRGGSAVARGDGRGRPWETNPGPPVWESARLPIHPRPKML